VKITISFDQIKATKLSCLDAAITLAFPGTEDVQKDGLTGLPCGTVTVDGKPFDWLLKAAGYVFIPSA